MHIYSWNVNGIRAVMRKGFHDFVKGHSPDMLCLQEIKAQYSDIEKEIELLPGYHFYCYPAEKKGYSGTAILTKHRPDEVIYDMGHPAHANEGRVLTLHFPDFYLVNVYVPNSKRGLLRLDYREQWDADFRNFLQELQQSKPVIVTGDMNVAHEGIDIARPQSNYNKTAGYTQREIDSFKAHLGIGLVDVFRQLYPGKQEFSWWSYMFNARAKNIGWRLDYFLVSEGLLPKVKDSYILCDVMGSDHCPVGLELH